MKTIAKALLFDTQSNILLLRRSLTHPNFPHHFDFPGGEVELGESPALAVSREILEETKLSIHAPQLEQLYEKSIDSSTNHLIFTGQMDTEKPPVELSWEHDHCQWNSLSDFMSIEIPDGADDYFLTVMGFLNTIDPSRLIHCS